MTLKEQRQALGLTPAEVAKIAGVAASAISRIESGRCKSRTPAEHKARRALAALAHEREHTFCVMEGEHVI